MNRKALHSLADFIEQRQDIDFYYPDVRSCVLGFAARQLAVDHSWGPSAVSRIKTSLGINDRQAAAMFAEPETADGVSLLHSDISRENAVTMLRRAAETGSIFFDDPTRGDRTMGDSCGCPICSRNRSQGRTRLPRVDYNIAPQSDRRTIRTVRGIDGTLYQVQDFGWEPELSADVKEPETA